MLLPRFDAEDIRRFLFEVSWHPYGGGGLMITRTEALALDIDDAIDVFQRVTERRAVEASAVEKAVKASQRGVK